MFSERGEAMNNDSLLGPWLRRFLLDHLVSERNLSRSTQRSYRDTLRLLIPFVSADVRKTADQLTVVDVSADLIRRFLQHLEEQRHCSVATRNQRLAAVHALARYIGLACPELIAWSGEVRAVPFKKAAKPQVTYLEKEEIDALLAAPDRATAQGRRDYALLLFLYNTGARADEAAQLRIVDLDLADMPQRSFSSARIRGKGNKLRQCPLWGQTVEELKPLTEKRQADEHVFLNRRGQPLTRFGIHTLVERHVAKASAQLPSLAKKRVSPHTIRHATATHLLRAGVDLNTIRAWLGHVSLETTNIYAEIDLEMKAKALAHCEIKEKAAAKDWREDEALMTFLRSL
jgi:integrase/recombinase XerD